MTNTERTEAKDLETMAEENFVIGESNPISIQEKVKVSDIYQVSDDQYIAYFRMGTETYSFPTRHKLKIGDKIDVSLEPVRHPFNRPQLIQADHNKENIYFRMHNFRNY